MKQIQTNSGQFILVDDEDYPLLSRHTWIVNSGGYAVSGIITQGGKKQLLIHQLILGGAARVDHKDGNGLNNQKENLRECSHTENMQNRKYQKHSSKFKGVNWIKKWGNWAAGVRFNKKRIHLGTFYDERLAALAYDEAAKKYFGKFAKTNKELGLL